MARQTPILVNPLSLEEINDIRDTLRLAEMEIVRPGTAAMYNYDLLDMVNDALYRISDVIESECLMLNAG